MKLVQQVVKQLSEQPMSLKELAEKTAIEEKKVTGFSARFIGRGGWSTSEM